MIRLSKNAQFVIVDENPIIHRILFARWERTDAGWTFGEGDDRKYIYDPDHSHDPDKMVHHDVADSKGGTTHPAKPYKPTMSQNKIPHPQISEEADVMLNGKTTKFKNLEDSEKKIVKQAVQNGTAKHRGLEDYTKATLPQSALTDDVQVEFDDGSTSRFGDLNDVEKKAVTEAAEAGNLEHRGFESPSIELNYTAPKPAPAPVKPVSPTTTKPSPKPVPPKAAPAKPVPPKASPSKPKPLATNTRTMSGGAFKELMKKHGNSVGKASHAVEKSISNQISGGGSVKVSIDGKDHNITSVKDGVMHDDAKGSFNIADIFHKHNGKISLVPPKTKKPVETPAPLENHNVPSQKPVVPSKPIEPAKPAMSKEDKNQKIKQVADEVRHHGRDMKIEDLADLIDKNKDAIGEDNAKEMEVAMEKGKNNSMTPFYILGLLQNSLVASRMNKIAFEVSGLSPEETKTLEEHLKHRLYDSFDIEDAPVEDVPAEGAPAEEVETPQEEVEDDAIIEEPEKDASEEEMDITPSENAIIMAYNGTGRGTKDKDLMQDTGGKSKYQKEPDFKPSREDCKKHNKFDDMSKNDKKDFKDVKNDPDLKNAAVIEVEQPKEYSCVWKVEPVLVDWGEAGIQTSISVASFNEGHGNIIVDDNCWIVCNNGKPTIWIADGAAAILRTLPSNPLDWEPYSNFLKLKLAGDTEVWMDRVPFLGKLSIDRGESPWGKLVVPETIRRVIYKAIDGEKLGVMPDYEAHISVFDDEEVGKLPKLLLEEGSLIPFTLEKIETCKPAGWDEVKTLWMATVKAPELELLREKYGFKPLMHDDHQFHITIAIKEK